MSRRLADDKRGVTALEYALIAAFVAIVAYGGASIYGTQLGKAWTALGTAVP